MAPQGMPANARRAGSLTRLGRAAGKGAQAAVKGGADLLACFIQHGRLAGARPQSTVRPWPWSSRSPAPELAGARLPNGAGQAALRNMCRRHRLVIITDATA